ncbi:MAG TPA: hypothetical protein VKU62_08780 [Thermoanaerobaculia bacterium]|nr:hypothetical protein [Thermoanaerobaculia bacterium]
MSDSFILETDAQQIRELVDHLRKEGRKEASCACGNPAAYRGLVEHTATRCAYINGSVRWRPSTVTCPDCASHHGLEHVNFHDARHNVGIANNCAGAAFAMLLRLPYREALKRFPPELRRQLEKGIGPTFVQMFDALTKLGFAISPQFSPEFEVNPAPHWRPLLDFPVNIAAVDPRPEWGAAQVVDHAVIVLHDGTVLDCMLRQPSRFCDYSFRWLAGVVEQPAGAREARR